MIFSGAVKLQKERDRAKKEKKKEKKREKKEKSREEGGKKEEKQLNHKKRQYEEFQSSHKIGDHLKTREEELGQLEKSSLTEERGPAAVQNLCDSSDSTQNSGKRRRHASAEISHHTPVVGLRIRLPLLRHKDSEPPSANEQPCFSGRIETIPVQQDNRAPVTSSAEQPFFSGRIDTVKPEELAKTSHGKHASAETRRIDSSGCSCDSDVRRKYKYLIRNWNPPPVQTENLEVDDQDWLFGKTARRPHGRAESRGEVASKDSDLGSTLCSWPPQACYLPEAGIYALPYVVPF